jgi:hypothetical protein
MNMQFKGLGGSPKSVAFLGGLLLLLGYLFYSNVLAPSDDAPAGHARQAAAPVSQNVVPDLAVPAPDSTPRSSRRTTAQRLDYKMPSRDKRPDPTTIDPTLRLDLLAKVQSVNLGGGERNLFQFGAAPPPPRPPEPKIIPPKPGSPAALAAAAVDNKPGEPPTPPPPPIPLKFYGYSSRGQTDKRAFFLDGEDIIVASEGQLIKSRYKVIRIGVNSVVVEDVQFQHQQTLPLEEQPGTVG